ncbi:phage terminase small subunit [Shewanella algae]|uniref:phage terminase small subunit n=1 Tax=Shewanella algae TaxID=38313 RepID=UPI0023586CBD|nr:phage terminase small subunit [Shewanella algae]MDC8855990.1 phage terminase small subunit [Shewanella algae]
MISPAADWREQQTFVSAPSLGTDNGTLHRQFDEDISFIKQLSRQEDRQAYKRDTLLPRYLPEVERYLAAGKVYVHTIFVQCIIWLFDTEQFDLALAYAGTAIKQGQPSPFRRPLCVFAADTIYQWAERQFEARQPIDPYFAIVLSHMRSDWRLPEALCARYCKLAGQYVLSLAADNGLPSHIHDRQTLETALKLFEMAHQEYPKIGVKTLITRIQMRLNALNNQ